MEALQSILVVLFLALPLAQLLLLAQHMSSSESWLHQRSFLAFVWIAAATLASIYSPHSAVLPFALAGVVASWLMSFPLRAYFSATAILYPIALVLPLVGLAWSLFFISSLDISPTTYWLMLLSLATLAIAYPAAALIFLPQSAYLLKRRFSRAWHAPLARPRNRWPKVSIHVPTYSEPPDMVCATLDKLAGLNYTNFEVLLVDNNTADPSLWRPVKAHCQKLNRCLSSQQFRFFHVDNLTGAKAGALNYALERTAEDADYIAVIDADYQARPDFLSRIIPFFDDPAIGYVQTPHDYREWQRGTYLRACYWEYMLKAKVQLPSLNDWVATIMVGTMCVIRREALEKAGGWATWCLSEDSELSTRIHAVGYHSHYIPESFGLGIIPDTFAGYKKQRRRWTMGPIQHLLHHWRLFLPDRVGQPSHLTFWQRVLELHRGLSLLSPLLIVPLLPLGIALVASVTKHGEVIPIPNIMLFGLIGGLCAQTVQSVLAYRLVGCERISDLFLLMLASMSLQHTLMISAWKVVLPLGPLRWDRTDKFKSLPNRWRILQSVQLELSVAAVGTCAAGALWLISPMEPNLLWFLVFSLLILVADSIAAVCMTLLAEIRLSNEGYLGLTDEGARASS